ncbi:hypothetical protein SERLADRAFT_477926 [Serpula lacrymans var. lacrymans S7.9]|nr:uncharacterized protein SERLADRAFT_477926 [Serpula lacrymans var. lacrymans S7.9]EGO20387.1 hypothetical protein SERLADRAFT_477926 [Serpula lacrymans var. lacrymans S7.9]
MPSAIGHHLQTLCPTKTDFAADKIPDMSGKVVIVTGGNAGIGRETVRALLVKNAKVYLAARNPSKAQEAIDDLRESTGKEALFLKLDLADLKSVKASAQEFLSKETRLDVLFNNGGVMIPPIEQLTADGYDLQFGTNVLGHFFFTQLLLPLLLSSAQSSPDGKVRVVNTSSAGHSLGSLDYATVRDGPERKKKGTMMLYSQSKFGNVVFALELHRRYGAQGIVSTSLHPGLIKTELLRHASKWSWISDLMLYDVAHGALNQLYAGTVPEAVNLGGKYLVPWVKVSSAIESTNDPEEGRKLWTWLEEQVRDI